MRRVLVPLDGSKLAESILSDARDVAGPDGELILVRETRRGVPNQFGVADDTSKFDEAQDYLEQQAALLRAQGAKAEGQALQFHDVALAIDEATKLFNAQLIACATHGRGALGRLVRGSVAWKLLAKSTVPVLLRHAEDDPATQMGVRRGGEIMIPLDGSAYAEKVIPMAKEFALEWGSRLNLVRIVPDLPVAAALGPAQYEYTEDVHLSERYLDRIANSLVGEVRTIVRVGGVVSQLVTVASELSMSHIFLASHGRTVLKKMIVGSVADSLIQCLHLPIIVLPALANGRLEEAPRLEQDKSLVYA